MEEFNALRLDLKHPFHTDRPIPHFGAERKTEEGLRNIHRKIHEKALEDDLNFYRFETQQNGSQNLAANDKFFSKPTSNEIEVWEARLLQPKFTQEWLDDIDVGQRQPWNSFGGKSGISSANLAFNRQQWVRKHPIERRNGPITVNCLAGDRYVLHDIFQRGCCLQVKLSTSGKLFASVLSWYAPTRGT